MATVVQAYECPRCYSLHTDEIAAQDCCGVEWVFAFRCDACGDVYAGLAEARACHAESK